MCLAKGSDQYMKGTLLDYEEKSVMFAPLPIILFLKT